jgi:LITAF-like zinc ribbon domain
VENPRPVVLEDDYPMAEAVPMIIVENVMDTDARPPSLNPNYHSTDNDVQVVPIVFATPAPQPQMPHTTPTTAMNSVHHHVAVVVHPTSTSSSSIPCQHIPPYTIGRRPTTIVCPYCQVQMQTRIRRHANMVTWIIVILLGCFFWPFCLCFLPFCCAGCLETEHYCTHCHRKVAAVEPFTS